MSAATEGFSAMMSCLGKIGSGGIGARGAANDATCGPSLRLASAMRASSVWGADTTEGLSAGATLQLADAGEIRVLTRGPLHDGAVGRALTRVSSQVSAHYGAAPP